MFNSNDTTIETSDGSTRLSVKNVSAENSAIYVLTAENKVGKATAEFNVTVKGMEIMDTTCVGHVYIITKFITCLEKI